jgi:hypothetical protein
MHQAELIALYRSLNHNIVKKRMLNTVFTIDKNLSLTFYQDNICTITAKRLSFSYDMEHNFSAATLIRLLLKHNIISNYNKLLKY